MTCRTLLLAHTRMAQPLAWSGGSLCVAYARASMPRVPRGPRRPPRHAWHRLARASLVGPAPASLLAIMAAPALAIGAAEEASGRSFEALSAKMNVHVPLEGDMVIFNVCSRSKWLIPRAKTLLWHAQNTKDHCLTQSWAGLMTVRSFYFFRMH